MYASDQTDPSRQLVSKPCFFVVRFYFFLWYFILVMVDCWRVVLFRSNRFHQETSNPRSSTKPIGGTYCFDQQTVSNEKQIYMY